MNNNYQIENQYNKITHQLEVHKRRQFYQMQNVYQNLVNISQSNKDPKIQVEYNAKLKSFLEKLNQQVGVLIENYEKQIEKLKNENRQLRAQLKVQKQFCEQNPQEYSPPKTSQNSKYLSVVRKESEISLETLLNMQRKDKNVMKKVPFSTYGSMKSSAIFQQGQNQFSKFELEKLKKKQQQGNLFLGIEHGKMSSLDNKAKLFSLIGKDEKKDNGERYWGSQNLQKTGGEKKSRRQTAMASFYCSEYEKREMKLKQRSKKQFTEESSRIKSSQFKERAVQSLLKNLRHNIVSAEKKQLSKIQRVKIFEHENEQSQDTKVGNKGNCMGSNSSKGLVQSKPRGAQQTKQKIHLKTTSNFLSDSNFKDE